MPHFIPVPDLPNGYRNIKRLPTLGLPIRFIRMHEKETYACKVAPEGIPEQWIFRIDTHPIELRGAISCAWMQPIKEKKPNPHLFLAALLRLGVQMEKTKARDRNNRTLGLIT